MSRVIKSATISELEGSLLRQSSISDVVFSNDFETLGENELGGDVVLKRSLVDKIFTQVDDLRETQQNEQVEKTIETSQRLLENASEVLSDSRLAYRKAVKKGRQEARELVRVQKGKLVKLERSLKKRLKQGFNRGLCSGYEEGFALGQQAAKEETKAQLLEALDELEKATQHLNLRQEEIFEKYEEKLIDLAFTIAQKVTATALDREEKVYCNIVKEALAGFKDLKWVEITVADLETSKKLMADKQTLQEAVGPCENIRVEVSDKLEEHGLIIDTQAQRIEASPEVQISKIREKLRGKKKT